MHTNINTRRDFLHQMGWEDGTGQSRTGGQVRWTGQDRWTGQARTGGQGRTEQVDRTGQNRTGGQDRAGGQNRWTGEDRTDGRTLPVFQLSPQLPQLPLMDGLQLVDLLLSLLPLLLSLQPALLLTLHLLFKQAPLHFLIHQSVDAVNGRKKKKKREMKTEMFCSTGQLFCMYIYIYVCVTFSSVHDNECNTITERVSAPIPTMNIRHLQIYMSSSCIHNIQKGTDVQTDSRTKYFINSCTEELSHLLFFH